MKYSLILYIIFVINW